MGAGGKPLAGLGKVKCSKLLNWPLFVGTFQHANMIYLILIPHCTVVSGGLTVVRDSKQTNQIVRTEKL